MGQVINVTSRKFFNQLTNGESFNTNTGDYATHLLGSVGEKVKADITFSISWFAKASAQNRFTTVNLGGGSFSISRPSGSFIDDGLKINDTVDVLNENPGGTINICLNGTITYIDDNLIYITGTYLGSAYGSFPNLAVRGKTPLTGMKLFYGIVENSQPAGFFSKIDNSSQGFYASGLTTSPTTANFLGINQSWMFDDTVQIYKVSTSGYVQTFRFTHEFIITPFFLDGEQSNIENIIDPPYFQQNESLKYVFRADINVVLSNPNTVHTFTDDLLLGEVAYYNENFNGFLNQYSTSNLEYESASSGNTADGILIQEKTTVSFRLACDNATFSDNNTRLVVGIFYLCPADEYSNTSATTGQQNFMFYSKRCVADSTSPTPVSNGDITNLTATFVNTARIDIEFDFELSASEKARLTTSGQFCVFVIVENHTLSSVLSDKVNLIVDVGTFDLATDIAGLISFAPKPGGLFIHPQNPFTSSAFSSIRMWLEDGFMAMKQIRLVYSTYPDANITDITGRLIAYNSADGRKFDLDSFTFDLSTVQTIDGVQQLELSQSRGFKLDSDDPFQNAIISMPVGVADVMQEYKIWIPFKMRYEDFISNPNVPSDFFDSAEENDNRNYKASNYALAPDWTVRVAFDITVNTGTTGMDTISRHLFYQNLVHDYDVDGNTPPEWTCEIELYRASNNALISSGGDSIALSNENTLVRAVFTPATGTGALIYPWAVIRMEVLNSGQKSIYELPSVVRTALPESPLIPEAGENGAKMLLNVGNVYVSGLIDYTKLNPGAEYKLSARLGGVQVDPDEYGFVFDDGSYLVTDEGDFLLVYTP